MVNLSINGKTVDNQSRIAKVNTETKGCDLFIPPSNETRHALLGNLFYCEGKPGKVREIEPRRE